MSLLCAVCLASFALACEEKSEVIVPDPGPVITLNIAPDPVPTLNVGQTVQLVAIVSGSPNQNATWTSSNSTVATVNATTGVVSALAPGVAVITAVSTVDATARDAVTVQVVDRLTPIVTPSPVNLEVGAKRTLSVIVRNSAGVEVTGRTITHTSGNPAVATVTAAGEVTGVAVGSTSITTTVTGTNGQSVETPVAVTAPQLGVTISQSSAALAPGGSAALTCTVRNLNTNAVVTVPLTWSSSNPAVATVSATGQVTAVADGSATITCSAGPSASASAQVTVSTPPLTLTASPNPVSVQVGASASLQVTVRDAAGAVVTGRTITYVSAHPNIATVTSGGQVTGVAVGTTSLTITVAGPGGGSINVPVTVGAPALRVELSASSVTLQAGQSAQLTCTVRNANDNTVVSGAAVVWSSSNPAVATVSASGLVAAQADGFASVTCATAGGEASASAAVTVSTPPLTITVSPTPVGLMVAQIQQLAVAVTDAAGAPVTGRTITFASANAGVASVSATGLVTGVSPGSTSVTVTVAGPGGGVVSVPVTVGCGSAGTFTGGITVLSDQAGHAPYIGMPGSMLFTVSGSGTTIIVSGTSPFVVVSGSLNPSTCQFTATGSGTVAGYPNTSVRLTGTYPPGSTTFDWTYRMGANGELPGAQPIDYRIRRQ